MSERVPKNLMHEPITHAQKVEGLARLMAGLRSRGERAGMAARLEKLHGRKIAQEIVDEARTVLRNKKQRGRAK